MNGSGSCDGCSDHRADCVGNSGEIGFCHSRQAALQGNHIVAEQVSERRVQRRPASSIEQRRNIPECVACHEELDPVHMRPLMQEFLSQRPEVGHPRRYLKLCTRRLGEMRAPRAIADDPVIDRISPEVAFASQDMDGRRRGSANRQAAQRPEIDLGWKLVAGRVLGYHVEDGLVPLPPGFELIPRAEGLCRKSVRCHGPSPFSAALSAAPIRAARRTVND